MVLYCLGNKKLTFSDKNSNPVRESNRKNILVASFVIDANRYAYEIYNLGHLIYIEKIFKCNQFTGVVALNVTNYEENREFV